MKMLKMTIPALLSMLTLAGCSFAPDYVRPDMDLPVTWGDDTYTSMEVEWWKRFGDPVLDALVAEALANNRNLDVAMARVDQARSYLGVAQSQQYPSVNGSASGIDNYSSLDTSMAPLLQSLGMPASRRGESWSTMFQTVWEIDLWGKYRNSTAAAREQLLATEAAHKGTALGVAAQTCVGYFNLRNYDYQLELAQRTLYTREQALKIWEARYAQGLISELDLLRARTEVSSMKANIYTAQYQVSAAESALMVLTGRSPRDIFLEMPERGLRLDDIPSVPQIPAGLPSDLLTRRPDIIAAEAGLRAANFQIGVAKANWFPSISLTGAAGWQSGALDGLLHGNSFTWNYGASITAPILNAGRISNNVRVSEAAMREAVASYELTVQQAFQEVRDALVLQNRTIAIVEALEEAVQNLQKAVDLAMLRYDNGYAAYLEVLDAERSLFDAQIQLANVRTNHLSAIIQVCLALGGGWDDPRVYAQEIVPAVAPAVASDTVPVVQADAVPLAQ